MRSYNIVRLWNAWKRYSEVSASRQPLRPPLWLELLEDRNLLSVTFNQVARRPFFSL